MTGTTNITSIFPPPAPDAPGINELAADIGASGFAAICDALPIFIALLDQHLRIVFANRITRETLSAEDVAAAIGRRPGDLFHCANAERAQGCGTHSSCAYCGAARALLEAATDGRSVRECRMTRKTASGNQALDLRVWSERIVLGATSYIIFSALDVSHEKRRFSLERLFLHGMLDSLSGMRSMLGLLRHEVPQIESEIELVAETADDLLENINAHKDLLAAESNLIRPKSCEVPVRDVLRAAADRFRKTPLGEGIAIVTDDAACGEESVFSDPLLVSRVLAAMVQNALEASEPGQEVVLTCTAQEDSVTLKVRNPAVMPASVKAQVFQRSFTTKGKGRGLGTYSMRLLAENYLRGSVDFISEAGHGTIFTLTLPRETSSGAPSCQLLTA